MRELKQMKEYVDQYRNQPLILATLIHTEGSSYRRAGACKVISLDGKSVGMISGGCLENQIIEKALYLTHKKEVANHVFDTTLDSDRFFGSGTGCRGRLTIEFKKTSWEELKIYFDKKEKLFELNVHIVGAGADTNPLFEMMSFLGWKQKYYSKRLHIIEQRIEEGRRIENLSSFENLCISNPERTAVLLMSHNFEMDLYALSRLVHCLPSYIGILGPEERKFKLLEDLYKVYSLKISENDLKKIYGPVGLSGMGRGETSISLAIIGQLQQIFFRKVP